jgi:hypothetical protein
MRGRVVFDLVEILWPEAPASVLRRNKAINHKQLLVWNLLGFMTSF